MGLLLMDTTLPENKKIIFGIQNEGQFDGFLEAFAESVPQMVVQLFIIFNTGEFHPLQ